MLAKALTAAFGGDVEQMSKGSVQRFEAGEVRLKFRPGQTNETGQVVMYAGPPSGGMG